MNRMRRAEPAAAIVAALSVLVQPATPFALAVGQGQPPAKPPATSAPPASGPAQKPPATGTQTTPAPKPAAAPTAPPPIDGGWPRMS